MQVSAVANDGYDRPCRSAGRRGHRDGHARRHVRVRGMRVDRGAVTPKRAGAAKDAGLRMHDAAPASPLFRGWLLCHQERRWSLNHQRRQARVDNPVVIKPRDALSSFNQPELASPTLSSISRAILTSWCRLLLRSKALCLSRGRRASSRLVSLLQSACLHAPTNRHARPLLLDKEPPPTPFFLVMAGRQCVQAPE